MSQAKTAVFGSSIFNKVYMALTGLFLCTFLVAHMAGNLQLLIPAPQGQIQFNEYTKFMTSNPIIKIASYLTYFSILFHAFKGLWLVYKNRQARPVKYAYEKPGANSIWASRNMGLLGTVMLVFIILHMNDFWAQMKFGHIPTDPNGLKDLYSIVISEFQNPFVVIFYVINMVAIAFHLWHGFKSGFQSLGINHKKYNAVITYTGYGFAVIVPFLFAIIPVYIYLTSL